MNLRHIVVAVAAFLALPVIAPYADDGLKSSVWSLLYRANNFLQPQTFSGDNASTFPNQVTIQGLANPLKQFAFGLNTSNNYAAIQPLIQGTGYIPTYINPLGGGVELGTNAGAVVSGEVAMGKIAASGTAPGAGTLKFAVVAGTTGGTCKIIAYAGTSTAPSTILDNIGSGC